MKKPFLTVLALCAFATSAFAAPDTVTNATGTVVYGAHTALMIQKDTASGNRVAVTYATGAQYVTDDAAWSKYAKLVAALGARGVAVDNDPLGTVIAVSDSNGVYCYQNKSLVAFPTLAQGLTVNDGCAYWAKVKALSN